MLDLPLNATIASSMHSLFPMGQIVGPAGSHHSFYHRADIPGGDDESAPLLGDESAPLSMKCRNRQIERNLSRVMRPATGS